MRFISKFIDVLFPPRCPFCDGFTKRHDSICKDCDAKLIRIDSDANFPNLNKIWLDRCRSCFAFEGPVKDALHNFKYQERIDLASFFGGELLSETGKMGEFEFIVPVPLHIRKLKKRGFNQSLLMARHLGKKSQIKVLPEALRRVKDIPPQVGLERAQRIENVKDAFAVSTRHIKELAGKNILIVDDVVTTGATVNECARSLKKAGAGIVSAVSIARTL